MQVSCITCPLTKNRTETNKCSAKQTATQQARTHIAHIDVHRFGSLYAKINISHMETTDDNMGGQ